jgi:hypothetical protein
MTTTIRLVVRAAAVLAVALILGAASVAVLRAYTTNNVKWPTNQALYYINPANGDVSEAAAEAAIRAGAAVWSEQSRANFTFVYAGRTSGTTVSNNRKNEVFFRPESSGSTVAVTYWWYDGARNLVDADIKFFDAGFLFFTGASGCSGGVYIEDIAAHEFGHALGLSHSAESAATMYSTTGWCSQVWRTLDVDDIAGVEFLYPPAGSATPPAAPTNLTATLSASAPASTVTLAWTDNSANEHHFLVERSQEGGAFQQIARVASDTVTHADSSLTAATSYAFRVRASNSYGFSNYTNLAMTTTAPAGAPSAPTALSPSHGARNVNVDISLAWNASGATSYDVYFGTSSSPGLHASQVTATSLTLPRLTAGTNYYWRVVAHNRAGSTTGSVWSFTTKSTGKKK